MNPLALATIAALIATTTVAHAQENVAESVATEIRFSSHDDLEFLGRLTTPRSEGPHPVVIYVQTAEGMTIEQRRPKGGGETFDYLDLYAEQLPKLGVAFFRYQGRGVTMGD